MRSTPVPIPARSLGLGREGRPVPSAVAFAFGPVEDSAVPALLSDRELHTWQGFRYPLRRQNYVLGRVAAKRALAEVFPGFATRDIAVTTGVFGQPVVELPGGAAELSIAHSRGAAVAVACVGGHPVGIDLEWIDPAREAVVQTGLSAAERDQWSRLGLPPLAASFLAWSAREAMSKAIRCGLTLPLELLALTDLAAAPGGAVARFPNFPQYAVRSWVAGGFALSLVTPRRTEVAYTVPDEVAGALAAAGAVSPPPGEPAPPGTP